MVVWQAEVFDPRGLMVRSNCWNGRKHYGTSSSRLRTTTHAIRARLRSVVHEGRDDRDPAGAQGGGQCAGVIGTIVGFGEGMN